MELRCAEFEVLLCDAVDGTLTPVAEKAFAEHRAACPACDAMASDVLSAASFLAKVPAVEPPKELVTKILFEVPAGKPAEAKGVSGLFGRLFGPIFTPKLAMGMAMTVLSFSMIAQLFKGPSRNMTAADLNPVNVWQSVEDKAHRVWSRTVQYYDNLRLVIELQSQLDEWTAKEEDAERRNPATRNAERIGTPEQTAAPEATKEK